MDKSLINTHGQPLEINAAPTHRVITVSDSPKLNQFLHLVLSTFIRWWKVVVPCGLVIGAILGGAVWLVFAPNYASEATLLIKEQTPYIAFPKESPQRAFVGTQLQLFRTRAVLGPALEQVISIPMIAEAEEPSAWLEERLTAQVIKGSELVKVRFVAPDPRVAQTVLDAVLSSYIVYHHDYDRDLTRRVIKLLVEERDKRKNTLEELRQSVRHKSQDAAVGSATKLSSDADPLSPMRSIQNLLVQTEVDIEFAKAQLEAARGTAVAGISIPEFELERMVKSQPTYTQLSQQLADYDDRLSQWQDAFISPEASSRYQVIKKERDQIQDALTAFEKDYRVEAQQTLANQLKSDRVLQMKDLENEIESKKVMRDFLSKRLLEERDDQVDVTLDEVDLGFLQTALAREEEVYNKIVARIVSLQTEQVAPARVEVIDKPTKPVTPTGTRLNLVIFAALAGSLIPLGIVVVWEYFLQRVTDSTLIRDRNMEVLGEVATLPKYLPQANQDDPDGVKRQLTLFEESIDHLCTSLRLSRELSDKQVIAITSAISGEGKTHVATQLAISLSRGCKEPVLLMEADLRSPDVARLLGVPSEPGLLDVFMNRCQLDDAITSHVDNHLDVLAAGIQARDLHGLLHQRDIEEVFAELRARYRYIVVDTPPVLAAGESLLFTAHADATLICARRSYSRLSQVQQVNERLLRTQANPIGVVLNGVPRRRYLHSYGAYGYSNA